VAADARFVEVANQASTASIRVRLSCVYEFGEDIYGQLARAYRKGDRDALQKLWAKATPFEARGLM
jgi:hypothetical protein